MKTIIIKGIVQINGTISAGDIDSIITAARASGCEVQVIEEQQIEKMPIEFKMPQGLLGALDGYQIRKKPKPDYFPDVNPNISRWKQLHR